jgi:hypothetical protein
MMPAMDLWTQILQFLAKVIIPDWGTVIAVLPILLIIGVVGPVLTLIALGWTVESVRHRRGRVRLARIEAQTAERDSLGVPIVPANVPYCPRDALVFAPRETRCSACGHDLEVRCPVDGTVRPAARQLCSACGTRFVLGELPALVAATHGGPPPGGAAAA